MSKVTLSTPWVSFARKIYCLFGRDPEINITYLDEEPEVVLYVDNPTKAEALANELPTEKNFGGTVLKITVVPSNKQDTPIDIYRKIFTGNPILKDIIVEDDQTSFGFAHVLFEKKVVQYFDDCLNDPNNLETTLYEDLARDVFENTKGVFFNTDAEDDFEIWP